MLGDFIDADEALRIGLVCARRRTPTSSTARRRASRRAGSPPGPTVAIRAGRRAARGRVASDVRGAIAAESAAQVANLRTEDAAEAIAAFLEKRDARFRGR